MTVCCAELTGAATFLTTFRPFRALCARLHVLRACSTSFLAPSCLKLTQARLRCRFPAVRACGDSLGKTDNGKDGLGLSLCAFTGVLPRSSFLLFSFRLLFSLLLPLHALGFPLLTRLEQTATAIRAPLSLFCSNKQERREHTHVYKHARLETRGALELLRARRKLGRDGHRKRCVRVFPSLCLRNVAEPRACTLALHLPSLAVWRRLLSLARCSIALVLPLPFPWLSFTFHRFPLIFPHFGFLCSTSSLSVVFFASFHRYFVLPAYALRAGVSCASCLMCLPFESAFHVRVCVCVFMCVHVCVSLCVPVYICVSFFRRCFRLW